MNLIASLLLATVVVNTPDLSTVRGMFQQAPTEEKQCRQLLGMLKTVDEAKAPLLAGYKGCATMIMAKHAFNPFTKLSYFNKGKKILEKAITADSENVELRYLRFAAQTNTPAFLGYKGNLKTDRTFLTKALPGVKDQYLRSAITKALNQ